MRLDVSTTVIIAMLLLSPVAGGPVGPPRPRPERTQAALLADFQVGVSLVAEWASGEWS